MSCLRRHPEGRLAAEVQYLFDGLIENGQSPFTIRHFLKRISKKNYWIESDWESCRTTPYGRSVANALCIGIMRG